MNRYVCIHGHFYQPPRENAWLEEVEMQDSAYPYHDWNERITAECYGPNAASRILDHDKKIIDIVNNYSKISFNFGPTLLSWMERHDSDVYQIIIEADLKSRDNFSGHGSALAQVYNHLIMPLANSRDKRTQITWGIRDFERRFGRRPEGMWLAETAVDLETLDLMAENEIVFTILAPRQAGRIRAKGKRWRDVSKAGLDPKRPYLCRLPSGRTINLFFYDGPISQDIAFGGLLNSGETFAGRLLGAFSAEPAEPQLVHIATDGETYGHHHRFGDMALSYCLHHIEAGDLAKITIYGQYLEKFPPTHEVEIVERTSWSCAHGVARWQSNCGCNTGRAGWTQHWRGPLREGLDWLRDRLAPIYEREMSSLVADPWKAREDYIEVLLDRSPENVEAFLAAHRAREHFAGERVRALRLLEMQRHAMLMYTSCGWFFDEISGLETTQVLQYAARAIQMAEKTSGENLEPGFLEILRRAPSNIPDLECGAEVYERYVKPTMVDLMRVGAHYAISSLFEDYEETETIYSYTAQRELYDRTEAGRQGLAISKARLRSNITWAEDAVSFAVMHLGDHNIIGGVRPFAGDDLFSEMSREIKEAFRRSDIPETIRLIDKHFETHRYSLWHLFRDEKRKIFGRIQESTLADVRNEFRRISDQHYPLMQVMREMNAPIPKPLITAAEFTINLDLRQAVADDEVNTRELENLVREVKRWPFDVDSTTLGFVATQKINALISEFTEDPTDWSRLAEVESLLKALEPLSLNVNVWKAQNVLFFVGRQLSGAMRERAGGGNEQAREWVARFESLSDYLRVRSV
jgi:alpha-amylase/alpha-mannosidase (GH57 family)